MAQGRDGISLAPKRTLKFARVARRLAILAATLAIVSFVVGDAGNSYAGSKQKKGDPPTQDTLVISNFGALFDGSVATFPAGSKKNAKPSLQITGTNTGLGSATVSALDAVSTADGHIAVAVPIIDFGGVDPFGDISGCGPFAGAPAGTAFGTGMVEIYSPGANGNSAPENIICSPGFATGAPDKTGIFFPGGVAFEDPFDGVHPGHDIVAVANNFPIVIGPDAGEAICAPPPVGGGAALGTVTEYDITNLGPGPISNVVPFNKSEVVAINPLSMTNPAVQPYLQNATIGGCLSLMLGPEALTFDESGTLFVVNNLGSLAAASAAAPRFDCLQSGRIRRFIPVNRHRFGTSFRRLHDLPACRSSQRTGRHRS